MHDVGRAAQSASPAHCDDGEAAWRDAQHSFGGPEIAPRGRRAYATLALFDAGGAARMRSRRAPVAIGLDVAS